MPRKKTYPNAAIAAREANESHVALAVYINATTGILLEPDQVALVQRLYPLFLKTPEQAKARIAAKVRRDEEANRKQAERERKARKALLDLEVKRSKLLSVLEESAGPKELQAWIAESGPELVVAQTATQNSPETIEDDDVVIHEATVVDAPKFETDGEDWDDDEPTSDGEF